MHTLLRVALSLLAAAFALGLVLAPASAAPAKRPANHRTRPFAVDDVKARLEVASDGKGHYLIHVPFSMCDDSPLEDRLEEAIFYGDGKTFARLPITGGGATCRTDYDRVFWEPRVVERWKASVAYKDKQLTVRCEDRVTPLSPLPKDEQLRVLGQATFLDSTWDRIPYAMARDERGVYYFVDKLRNADGNLDFRLYVGPRGSLKLQKMKNVVSDSEGDIFSTRAGELRLVLGKNEAAWHRGKKRTPLVPVPIDANARLIYTELGVYLGERLGTPCDDL